VQVGSLYTDQPNVVHSAEPSAAPVPAVSAAATDEPIYNGEDAAALAETDKAAAVDVAMEDAADAENVSGNV
jgi:hypothetical protein